MKDNDDEIRNQTMSLMLAYQTLLTEHRMDEWIELWPMMESVSSLCRARSAKPPMRQSRDQELHVRHCGKLTVNGVEDLQLHLTVNPRVIVVEMTISGTATQTGRPYNQRYVIVPKPRTASWRTIGVLESAHRCRGVRLMGHILVTGGTGKTGRRVVADLRGRQIPCVAASRSSSGVGEVTFDWSDPVTWNTPFAMSTLRTSSLRWARLTRPP